MCSGWCNNWVTRQHARCNNENKNIRSLTSVFLCCQFLSYLLDINILPWAICLKHLYFTLFGEYKKLILKYNQILLIQSAQDWKLGLLIICFRTYTVCPTRYRSRHFFNNSNTDEDIATKFQQEYVRCVRNEEEWVCSVCLIQWGKSASSFVAISSLVVKWLKKCRVR